MTLYITEYARLAKDANGNTMPMGEEPAIAVQTVATGGGSLQSSAFSSATKFVALHTDTNCHVVFGDDPTATTSKSRVGAGGEVYRGLGRAGLKIAVIAAA